MLRNLKYIALVIGFALILATKLKYQKRIANNPDKSTPYNKEEKTMLYAGYGFCALAILWEFNLDSGSLYNNHVV